MKPRNPPGQVAVGKLTEAPTVEVDTEAGAAYIRFRKGKVAKTVVQQGGMPLVTIDLDKAGNVLGVEIVGVEEFTLGVLLEKVPFVQISQVEAGEVRYVRARSLKGA